MFAWKVICFPVRVLRGTWRIPLGRGFLISLVVFTLLMVGAYFGERSYQHRSGERELARVIAHLDETDPDWRFVDLEARRQFVPDDQNSIPVIKRANRHIDATKHPRSLMPFRLRPDQLLNEKLSADHSQALFDTIDPHVAAIAVSRELRHYPRGSQRYITDGKGSISSWPNVADLGVLLSHAIETSLGIDRVGLAIEYLECLFCLAGAFDDDPTVSLHHFTTMEAMQRILALYRLNDDALSRMQSRFASRANRRSMGQRLRALRGLVHEELSARVYYSVAYSCSDDASLPSDWRWRVTRSSHHAKFLELFNHAIECAQLPDDAQLEALSRQLKVDRSSKTFYSDGFLKSCLRRFSNDLYGRAQMDAAYIALAVERHRARTGHWPDQLDNVSRELIPRVPTNPLMPGTFRMVHDELGVSIECDTPPSFRLSSFVHDPTPKPVRFRLFHPHLRGLEPFQSDPQSTVESNQLPSTGPLPRLLDE